MKREKWFLAAALCFLFIIFFAAGLIQTDGGNISIKPFSCVSEEGNLISGEIYRPVQAGIATPVPAIVTCAGGNNSHSMMRNLNVELARAGYAVITYSSFKHGSSDIAESETMGAEEILQYVRTLSFVDQERIGIMGHTRGSAYLFKAALDSGFVQAALSLDAIEIFGSLQGYTADTPINCGWIMSNYNEYLLEPRGYLTDATLLQLFGTTDTIHVGELYGDLSTKTARVLYAVNATDFAYPFSTDYVNAVLEFFHQALETQDMDATSIPVWFALEGIGFLSLLGMAFLVLVLSEILLKHLKLISPRPMSVLRTSNHRLQNVRHLIFALLIVAIPFFPLYMLGKRLLEPNALFPQNDTNGLAIWAFFACLIYLALLIFQQKDKTMFLRVTWASVSPDEIKRTFLAAAAVFAAIYQVNLLGSAAFHTTFRLFCTFFEPLNLRRILVGCTCFPIFLLYFLLSETFRIERLSQISKKGLSEYGYGVLFYTGDFALLYVLNYIGFFFVGHSLFHAARFAFGPMLAILPVMPIIGIISVWGHRKTGKIYYATLLNTFIFTWLLIGSNAFYYA